MFYGKTYVQSGFCFSGGGKTEACCGRFLEQKKSAAGFLLESSFSAAEERQSCSCAMWFLCRKNKLQQQVFIQYKKKPDLYSRFG